MASAGYPQNHEGIFQVISFPAQFVSVKTNSTFGNGLIYYPFQPNGNSYMGDDLLGSGSTHSHVLPLLISITRAFCNGRSNTPLLFSFS